MRYYDLQVLPYSGGQAIRHWTSHPNGNSQPPDPGALLVEFDLVVSRFAIPIGDPSGGGDYGNSLIRVWGIPLSDIGQAANLSWPVGATQPTYKVVFKGGMGKGLPLANPAQAGTLVQGSVFRAIGNWIGTDMTLDLYLAPLPLLNASGWNGTNTPEQPINNFTFNWKKGQSMAAAIRSTLQTAFPGKTIRIQINAQLILDRDIQGVYTTPQDFTAFVNQKSNAIIGPNNPQYLGVQIFQRNDEIWVTDGATTTSTASTGGGSGLQAQTRNISFIDLIGQPTWVANNVIQVTTVMRGDIQVGDSITLPVTLTTAQGAGATQNLPATFAQSRFAAQFQGTFQVKDVRHVGNYKAPQAGAWVTVLNCFATQGPLVPTAPPQTSKPTATPAPLSSTLGGGGE